MSPTPGPRILVVEDDDATRTALRRDLAARGFEVDEAPDGTAALQRWDACRPDLVLLDLGLPDLDGIRVLRRIRREATTPVVILSARDGETTKIEALEAGADDYVTKPFSTGELQARIKAVMRRAGGPDADAEGRLVVGRLVLDPLQHLVTLNGGAVSLTPREFEILRVFLAHQGRLVTRGRLLRAVWGEAYQAENHYVHVYVSQLRHKIAAADPDGALRDLFVAEPGVGYRVRGPDEPGGS
ncbi:MAG TPA: response regulator transcription factor [Candidatus Nanopelagicales bacterium]|nr:response regulator transcription factor [Candidatus Nanopelagicales bacterium]